MVIRDCFEGISSKFHNGFHEGLNDVSRVFPSVEKVFQGSFKTMLRVFQRIPVHINPIQGGGAKTPAGTFFVKF